MYSGMPLYMFNTDAASSSAAAIRADTALVTKIYYLRLLTLFVPIVSSLLTLIIGAVSLVAIMAWHEIQLGWALLLPPRAIGSEARSRLHTQ